MLLHTTSFWLLRKPQSSLLTPSPRLLGPPYLNYKLNRSTTSALHIVLVLSSTHKDFFSEEKNHHFSSLGWKHYTTEQPLCSFAPPARATVSQLQTEMKYHLCTSHCSCTFQHSLVSSMCNDGNILFLRGKIITFPLWDGNIILQSSLCTPSPRPLGPWYLNYKVD